MFACILTTTESILNPEGNAHGHNDDTRAAVKELNEVMRSLFPIVPRLSKMHWAQYFHDPMRGTSSAVNPHYGQGDIIFNLPQQPRVTNLIPRVTQRHQQQQQQQQPEEMSELAAFKGAIKSVSNEEKVQPEGRELSPVVAEGGGYPIEAMESGPSMVMASPVPAVTILPELESEEVEEENQLIHRNSQIPKLEGGAEIGDGGDEGDMEKDVRFGEMPPQAISKLLHRRQPEPEKPNNKLIGMLLAKIKDNANGHDGKGKEESTTPSLGKRGPECMRRCIQRGQLHPVQCHSLC